MFCSVEECSNPAAWRGMCEKHYKRMLRHGDPTTLLIAPRVEGQGYRKVRGTNNSRHVVAAVLGKDIPYGVEIHHVNGNVRDDSNTNLVVCPDMHYHALLHRRTRALDACGNPDYRPCSFCKKYDAVENLTETRPESPRYHHKACATAYMRKVRSRK